VTGPLPRISAPGTSTDPNSAPPPSVIPGGDSPDPNDPNGGAIHNGLDGANSGCAVSTTGTTGGAGGLVLVGLALLALRRKQEEK
jgi:MYXO-CTERM domain-containing protein